jgi:hypothetical protein
MRLLLYVLYQVAELVCSNEYRRKQWATYTNWIAENGKIVISKRRTRNDCPLKHGSDSTLAAHSYHCINASYE